MTHRKLTPRARAGGLRAALVLLLATALLPASQALANHGPVPPRTLPDLTITPSTSPQTWTGTLTTGANANYSFTTGEPCRPAPDPEYCDIMLLRVDLSGNPGFWTANGGGVQVSLGNYSPSAASDFDLQIFRSDAAGTKGPLVGSSGNLAGLPESFTITNADGYYLIQVVYFAVAASRYTGTAQFVTRNKIPPDVDVPPGLQEYLASSPALGFRSHSEPHIAQSPLDPKILVAGSKMYNKDPDSLAEYEFKIGTYVSFDGGVTWTNLGQLDVCPPSQTGPAFPNNICYPEEDPAKDGTGAEDGTRGGGGDAAEEYITSDVWLQFDDEGNAYVMVLDAPPFASGGGWGMTLHKWTSVSPADLQAGGQTWSHRIPISSYQSGLEQELFLDDKNTLAVSTAGDDGDGQTGTMVACWGLNIQVAIKQAIVCKSSIDGGETWPAARERILNDVQQLGIGVHVVADPNDPDTFYAVWLQYATNTGGIAPATMQFAKTFDGGLTWTTPSIPIALVNPIPRQFPGQSFRNLSIPIMAVGPASELYVTWADYQNAPSSGDADGKQAEIVIVRSINGGVTWVDLGTAPKKVNQDTGNADQFQQYVVVNPAGNVEVIYFDRRHDPDNFFIDTYLSRSSDMGQTFADTRLSHDMWDPTINPPISSSGDFIGDYQGLVADECFTIPFVNDTHLANLPSRDPDFDSGLPRSEFQEVFAWRVPTGACPGPKALAKVTGGGQVPGKTSSGLATFGLNARSTSAGASGHINVYDHGTKMHVKSVTVTSVNKTAANEVTILGTCSVDGGPTLSCEVKAIDKATPGRGQDEFTIKVGPSGAAYSAGGKLERGNVKVHK